MVTPVHEVMIQGSMYLHQDGRVDFLLSWLSAFETLVEYKCDITVNEHLTPRGGRCSQLSENQMTFRFFFWWRKVFFSYPFQFVDCKCNLCILVFASLVRSVLGKIRGKNASSLLISNIAVALLCRTIIILTVIIACAWLSCFIFI